MNIEPSSNISLYKDIPIADGEQIVFQSLAQQEAYFRKHLIREYTDCTYVRKQRAIRVEGNISVMTECNYISFRNVAFENKTIYARVVDYIYVNTDCVEIQFELDPWQTWMFDVSFDIGTIVREQLSQEQWNSDIKDICMDTEMITAEDLPVGEEVYDYGNPTLYPDTKSKPKSGDICVLLKLALPVPNSYQYTQDQLNNLTEEQIVALSVLYPMDGFVGIGTNNINGYPVSIIYGWINMQNEDWQSPQAEHWSGGDRFQRLNNVLNYLSIHDAASAIVGLYMVPKYLVSGLANQYVQSLISTGDSIIGLNVSTRSGDENINFDTGFKLNRPSGNLHPKMYTYPFAFIEMVSPNLSDVKSYRYEYFMNEVQFNLLSDIVGVPNVIMLPSDYLKNVVGRPIDLPSGSGGMYTGYPERMEYNMFPEMPYMMDGYMTYLGKQYNSTFQGYNINREFSKLVSLFGSSMGIVRSAGSDNPLAALGIASSVGNVITSATDIISTTSNINSAKQGRSNPREASLANNPLLKNTYFGDEYHVGDGGYMPGYLNPEALWNIFQVQIREDIRDRYSDYLKLYGCNSGRIGIPRVVNYLNGSIDASDIPQFTYTGRHSTTYCQANIHVVSTMRPVSTYIEDMFANGCLFIDGGELV